MAATNGFPFTDEELLRMAFSNYPNETWQKAFNYYNRKMSENGMALRRLNMGCRPCFGKVFCYILKQRFEQK